MSLGQAYIHVETLLPRMRLRCSINSVLPTTSAYFHVLRDVWHERPKHHSKSIHRRVRRKRQWLTSNGTIESDAAVQPPNLLFSMSRRVTSDRVLEFFTHRLSQLD